MFYSSVFVRQLFADDAQTLSREEFVDRFENETDDQKSCSWIFDINVMG